MANLRVGCAGWAYDDWVGVFYPRKLAKSDQLAHYAKFFDFVEVNSTFYNLPAKETLARWLEVVPTSFRFSIKVWNRITHAKADTHIETRISEFFHQLQVLDSKVSCFLFQFPPRLKYSPDNLSHLHHLLRMLPPQKLIVVELRDNSWFAPGILDNIFDDHHILGVSYLPGFTPYYRPEQIHQYLRLVGDRQLTVFNRVQRPQEEIMREVTDVVREFSAIDDLRDVFVIFNNHFTGFSPETANAFKSGLGLPVKNFTSQRTILDFYRK